MRPNKPGEWHARDGRKVVVYRWAGCLRWKPCGGDDTSCSLDELEGDDWLPAVAPAFPELPPKPPQCYARRRANGFIYSPTWWQVSCAKYAEAGVCSNVPIRELAVVPHPDNDPEAVRLITEATCHSK